MRQRGGRLLGKGSYACSFTPPPPCLGGVSTGTDTSLVGKISVQDMSDELAIGRQLVAIPGSADYYAVPTTGCTPRLPVPNVNATRCPILSDRRRQTRKLTLARMPAAGVPLSVWWKKRPGTEALLEHVTRHLLEGMRRYQSAGIVHNDIHWGNILVDERDVARYIDFGQAFRPTEIRSWDDLKLGRRMRATYIWLAPEIHAMRPDGVNVVYARNPEYKQLENEYPSRPGFKEAVAGLSLSEESVAYMRDGGGWRIDWWRLGICLWILWNKTEKRNERLRRVIGGLTEFHPALRMEPAKALRILAGTERRKTRRRISSPLVRR